MARAGWYLGMLKSQRFEPSQPLAMGIKPSLARRRLELSPGDQLADRYLRGETLMVEGEPGWTLVTLGLSLIHIFNEIGKAVEQVAINRGVHIIKNLCGHGLGRSLHEAPETILNYYSRFERGKIAAGQVLALEPFISDGPEAVTEGGYDEWALVVPKGHYVAQFEHSIIVLEGQTIITTIQPEEL